MNDPEQTISTSKDGLSAAAARDRTEPLRRWETLAWRSALATAATTLQERAWMLAERGRSEPREILAACDQRMAADCAEMARDLYVDLCPMMAYVREAEAA